MNFHEISVAIGHWLSRTLDWVSTNALASTVIGTLLAALICWLLRAFWRSYRDMRDANKIERFMANSRETTDYRFRRTQAIAAATKIPERRVADLAIRHKKIKRNTKEKESWRLDDDS